MDEAAFRPPPLDSDFAPLRISIQNQLIAYKLEDPNLIRTKEVWETKVWCSHLFRIRRPSYDVGFRKGNLSSSRGGEANFGIDVVFKERKFFLP